MDKNQERVLPLLLKVGGGTFGVESAALDAIEELPATIKPGEDPIAVGWQVFMDLLEMYGWEAMAFSNAWPPSGVIPFLVGKGMDFLSASEVSQETALSAWRSFRQFKPYCSAWQTWLLNIAERRRIDWLRKKYRRPQEDLVDVVIEHRDTIVITDDRGWSVPEICREWMESRSRAKAAMAQNLLLAYYGESWSPIDGKDMQQLTGLTANGCTNLFKRFVEEVERRENYCR